MKINGNRILCGIFGIYLTLALFIPQGIVLVKGYLCNKESLRAELSGEESAHSALKGILAECETVADPCGMPYTVYDDVFTVDKVRQHMDEAVAAAVNSQEYTPEVEDMRATLKQNVKNVLAEEDGVEDFAEYEEDIDDFCSQSLRLYKAYVNLSVYQKLDDLYAGADKLLLIASVVFVVLVILPGFFLYRLNGNFGEFLRDVSFATVASGLCNAILGGYLMQADPLRDLQLTPLFLRDGLRRFASGSFRFDLYVGLVTMVVGLVLFALSVAINLRANRKYQQ